MVGSNVFLLLTVSIHFSLYVCSWVDFFFISIRLFCATLLRKRKKKPITEKSQRIAYWCGKEWKKMDKTAYKINKFQTNVNFIWMERNSIDKRKQIERNENIYVKEMAFDNSWAWKESRFCVENLHLLQRARERERESEKRTKFNGIPIWMAID